MTTIDTQDNNGRDTVKALQSSMEYIDTLSKKGLDIDNKRILFTSIIIGLLFLISSSYFIDNLIGFYINNKYLRHLSLSLLFMIIIIIVLKIRHNK